MTTRYKEYLQKKREERIKKSLPEPLGEKAIAATSYVRREMTDISLRLSLVQAALGMIIDGKTRATATEVTDRVREELGEWVLPSVAGQIFSALDVKRVVVHGERRLVLEFDQLKVLHDELVERYEEIRPRAEQAAESFDGLMEQVQGLEERVRLIYRGAEREQYLRDFIVQHEQTPRRLADLERRYQHLEAQVRRCDQLASGMEGLSQRAKDLPGHEERHQQLQARLDEHKQEEEKVEARETDIREREGALESRLHRLKRRLAQVNLAELEETVQTKRRELDQEVRERRDQIDVEARERKQQLDEEAKKVKEKLDEQIRERKTTLKDLDKQIRSRRSLLGRVLGRDKEEGAP